MMRRFVFVPGLLALTACAVPYEEFEDVPELQARTNQISLAAQSDEPLLADVLRPPAARAPAPQPVAEDTVQAPKPAAREQKSLLAWLTQQAPKPSSGSVKLEADPEKAATLTDPVQEAKSETAQEPVQLASLQVDDAQPKTQTRSLWSSAPRRTAKGVSVDVPYGSVVAFGKVGRVCEARSKPLGQKVAKSEGRGQTYTIYDTAPGATTPRTFYVTGFSDRCPRQFTAALAMFGAPSMHESLRYGRPSDIHPYSETDKAYEQVKRSVCRVPAGKPCGAKIDVLERDTVFISTYERFTNNGRWADLLVHGGAVLAAAIKAP